MKKLLIGILSVIIIFSCNRNEDEQIDDSLVIGKWKLTKITNTSAGGFIFPTENETHYYQIHKLLLL